MGHHKLDHRIQRHGLRRGVAEQWSDVQQCELVGCCAQLQYTVSCSTSLTYYVWGAPDAPAASNNLASSCSTGETPTFDEHRLGHVVLPGQLRGMGIDVPIVSRAPSPRPRVVPTTVGVADVQPVDGRNRDEHRPDDRSPRTSISRRLLGMSSTFPPMLKQVTVG